MAAIIPPFTFESAGRLVRRLEGAINSLDPIAIGETCSEDTVWTVNSHTVSGRDAVVAYLSDRWCDRQQHRILMQVWAVHHDHVALRLGCEWHDQNRQWYRLLGNDNLAFDRHGRIRIRHAYQVDEPIDAKDRKMFWSLGNARPVDHPGLTDLGF